MHRIIWIAALLLLSGDAVAVPQVFRVPAQFNSNVTVAGTLTVTGAVTLSGALSVDSLTVGGGYGSTGATVSTAGVGQFNGALTTDGALTAASAVIGGGFGATGATVSAAGALSMDGDLTVGTGRLIMDSPGATFSGASSRQSVAADSAFSSFTGGYGAAVMGNAVGGTIGAGNSIIAGVIGKYNLADSSPSDHPQAAVVGEIGESVGSTTNPDGAFVAVIGGDSGQVNADAAFAVRVLNSTAGSGFLYGLDLYAPAIDSYIAASYTANIRLENQETIDNGTNGTVAFGRNDDGDLVLACSDEGATATWLTCDADAASANDRVQLPAQSVGASELVNDTVDGAQLADALALDAAFGVTGTAGETVAVTRTLTDATAEEGLTLLVTAQDTSSGTTAQLGFAVANAASTEGLDALIAGNNLDADDAVGAFLSIGDTGGGGYTYDFLDADDQDFRFGRASDGNVVFSCGDEGASATFLTCDADGADANAQVQLPTGSIGTGEILDGTVSADDIATDGVGDAEIANSVQSVPLSLGSWIDCDTLLPLDASGADAEPDFAAVNNAVVIAYDATGGSVDTDKICNSFRVPANYASGGTVVARITQGGATVTNIEDWSCAVSINGAALGAFGDAALANQTAIQTATSTPAGTFAAGDSVGVVCSQSDASANDTVNIHAVEFSYTGVR